MKENSLGSIQSGEKGGLVIYCELQPHGETTKAGFDMFINYTKVVFNTWLITIFLQPWQEIRAN